MGRVQRLDDARGRYSELVKHSFPRGMRLDGMRVVIDCANGAAYHVAPEVLWELGADVISIAVEPDGTTSRGAARLPTRPPRAIKWVIINHPWYYMA